MNHRSDNRQSENREPLPEREVVGLLAAAAEWQPEEDAPELLARAVLQRLEAPVRRAPEPGSRRRVAAFCALLTGGSLAAGAACAALALAIRTQPGVPTAAPLAHPAPILARADEPPVETAAGSVSAPRAPAEAARPERKRVRSRRRRPRPAPAARPKPQPQALAAANWEVETVQNDFARVVAPAWILEPDEERGELVLTPGVLDVIVPADSACGPADSGESAPAVVPVNEE